MPTYEHRCEKCKHEWEDIYSFKDPIPDVCPECNTKGKVKRLISLPAQGIVELTGRDLKNKLMADAQKMKREASLSENALANLVGESKYEENLSLKKKLSDIRPKIKRSRKKSA